MENINLTEEEIKQIKLLRASNIMYEKTKQKTLEMDKPNKKDVIDMLNKAQEDIIKQTEQHGITLEVIKPEFAINDEIKNSKIDLFEVKEDVQDEDLEEFAIHECIHYIQEVKDKKNYLIRMGLCDYTEFKIYGLGLNEASVQLMASKINGIPRDFVKYFGISFETISPSYYPLECCLVNQMAYITGEDVLFESTINSNDNFKKKFADLTSPKIFMTIQNAIDDILNDEESIIKLNNKIARCI